MPDQITQADLYDNTPENDKKFMEERIIALLEYLAISRNEIIILNGTINHLENLIQHLETELSRCKQK